MKLFKIYKGTNILAIREDVMFNRDNMKKHISKNDNIFEMEDMVIDPLGRVGSPALNRVFGTRGYYGFRKNGWVMLVHHLKVGIII